MHQLLHDLASSLAHERRRIGDVLLDGPVHTLAGLDLDPDPGDPLDPLDPNNVAIGVRGLVHQASSRLRAIVDEQQATGDGAEALDAAAACEEERRVLGPALVDAEQAEQQTVSSRLRDEVLPHLVDALGRLPFTTEDRRVAQTGEVVTRALDEIGVLALELGQVGSPRAYEERLRAQLRRMVPTRTEADVMIERTAVSAACPGAAQLAHQVAVAVVADVAERLDRRRLCVNVSRVGDRLEVRVEIDPGQPVLLPRPTDEHDLDRPLTVAALRLWATGGDLHPAPRHDGGSTLVAAVPASWPVPDLGWRG